MVYATEARIVPGARSARVREFTFWLARYGCAARVEWHRNKVVVELPEDDICWILTGGFAELVQGFEDCLSWRPVFRERGPLPPAGLPAPRLGP